MMGHERWRWGGRAMRQRQSKRPWEQCATAHTQERWGKKKEMMVITFWAPERELKYIQGSLYLHIRYSMIRAKHVKDERQKMKGKAMLDQEDGRACR
jgi:hypothetical protein